MCVCLCVRESESCFFFGTVETKDKSLRTHSSRLSCHKNLYKQEFGAFEIKKVGNVYRHNNFLRTRDKIRLFTAIIPQKNLLVTNTGPNVIIHIDIDTISNFNIPLDGLQNPMDVDYDPPTGRIYWTDSEEKTIRSANLDGSDIRLVRNLEEGQVKLVFRL